MTVETNNIHALRIALEKLEALREAIDDVALEDRHYARIDDRLHYVNRLLEKQLLEAERVLILSYNPC